MDQRHERRIDRFDAREREEEPDASSFDSANVWSRDWAGTTSASEGMWEDSSSWIEMLRAEFPCSLLGGDQIRAAICVYVLYIL